MPKTGNAFVSDLGELAVTISGDNVTNVSEFLTAETIIVDRSLVSFERENDPEVPVIDAMVTGDTTPIRTYGNHINEGERWVLTLIDDESSGGAKELGDDGVGSPYLNAVEIFRLFYENKEPVGGLACTPAGGETGDIETTLGGTIRVISISKPMIDSNAEDYQTRQIVVACENSSEAAHA